MTERPTAFALLSAGAGQRFGGNKLGADLGGKPLIRWAAEAASLAISGPRYLIVPPDAPRFDLDRDGWIVVTNPDASSGLASSIRAAALAASDCGRLVIGLADMPFITSAHLEALAECDGVAFTSYPDGRQGAPAAFPRAAMQKLASLEGDRGAGALGWEGATPIEPASPEESLDVDTPADLARARAIVALR